MKGVSHRARQHVLCWLPHIGFIHESLAAIDASVVDKVDEGKAQTSSAQRPVTAQYGQWGSE